jgi:hypothetical protein
MSRILEVTGEHPYYSFYGREVIGTQYDITESGEQEPIGSAVIVDSGESYVAVQDGADAVRTLDFTFDHETVLTDPADVAVFAASAALHRTAEAEAQLLVALGEEGFANL